MKFKWPANIPSEDKFHDFSALVSYESIVSAGLWPESQKKPVNYFNLLANHSSSTSQNGPWKPGLDALWTRLSSHPVYTWLKKDPNFLVLWTSFERKAAGKKAGKYGQPHARFRFVDCVVSTLQTFHICQAGNYTPRSASLDVKKKALSAIQELIECEHDGLRSWELVGDFGFRQKMDCLKDELQVAIKTHKKTPIDKHATHRYFVKDFLRKLLVLFDEAPPVLVKRFATLIGYGPDSVEKHFSEWISECELKNQKLKRC